MDTKDSSQDVAIARIEITVDKICKSVEHLVTVIDGTNSDGLKTKVALNRASINRAWWWLGGISLSIAGGAIWIIRGGLK